MVEELKKEICGKESLSDCFGVNIPNRSILHNNNDFLQGVHDREEFKVGNRCTRTTAKMCSEQWVQS